MREYWTPQVGDVFRISTYYNLDEFSYVSEFWIVKSVYNNNTFCQSWDQGGPGKQITSSFDLKCFNSEFCVPAYNMIYR